MSDKFTGEDLDELLSYPRRPGRRPMTCEVRKVHAVVCNGVLVDVFDAMCFLEGRKPHQLVHDVMRDYLREQAELPEVKKAMKMQRLSRSGIHPL